MAKVGRKARITETTYLKHVRKTRSTNDETIALSMGLNRSSVYRFRTSNPIVFDKAKKIVASFETVRFDPKNITYEMFKGIPVIMKWENMQIDNRVGEDTRGKRVSALFNVCNHLGVHPDQLTLDICSSLVVEARKAKENNVKFHYGLAYYSIRKPIRSFFQLIRGMSGELLSSRGIDAGRSSGTGAHSSQKVTKAQRDKFIEFIPESTDRILEIKRYSNLPRDIIVSEVKGISYFMYYSGTRIGATNPNNQGSLSVTTHNPKHRLSEQEWNINLIDKGKGGGIEWDKMLIDDGMSKMRDYVSKRFDIQPRNINSEMPEIESFMFPILNKHYDCERMIMKLALEKAGNKTVIPNHIWRHTFAQDFLHATDFNYELCASVGGWKDTGTLKLSYGEMSEEAQRRGLRKAMGLPVEDVTYELRF